MEDFVPSTFMSSSTMIGRIYGQDSEHDSLFDVWTDYEGRPLIKIRMRSPHQRELLLPAGACLLVQLFEHPDVLWLAQPTLFNEETLMVIYAPVEPIESADGRAEMPELAEVTLEQVDEAVTVAMLDRSGLHKP